MLSTKRHLLNSKKDLNSKKNLNSKKDYSNIKKDKAALKLVELIEQHPGEIDLLAVGFMVDKIE